MFYCHRGKKNKETGLQDLNEHASSFSTLAEVEVISSSSCYTRLKEKCNKIYMLYFYD